MTLFGASAASSMQIHVLIELVESALKEIELHIAVQDAATKAFASKHAGTRQAYMDLAIFFAGTDERPRRRSARTLHSLASAR